MKFLSLFLFIVSMSFSVTVNAEKSAQYTSESVVTAFYLSRDLTGYVKDKNCKECSVNRHKITAGVKAFLNRKEVALSRYVMSKEKPTNLVFDRKTNKLVRMNWYTQR